MKLDRLNFWITELSDMRVRHSDKSTGRLYLEDMKELRLLLIELREFRINYRTAMKEINDEVTLLRKTRIPRCIKCKKDMVKESEHSWKPNCDCFKNKNLRLSVG